jgi:signal transduction histidine kinase
MSVPLRRRAPWVHHALMRVRRAGLLWLLAWCGPLLVAAFVVLVLSAAEPLPRDLLDVENVYPNVIFGSLVPLLGALILSRLPRHPIGRLFLACGLASALTLATYPYSERGDLPGAVAAAWTSEWIWGLGLTPLVTIGVLLFPDGRLPGRGWRFLLASDVLGIVLVFVANALHPGPLENHPEIDNPAGIPLPHGLFDVLGGVGFGLFGVGLVGGAAAAVLRWRRARGTERAQLAWFAFTVALLTGSIVVSAISPVSRVVGDAVSVVAIPLLPVSVGVAILRRDLYGIEVVVRRSLVYATLTAVLLLGYAVAVTAAGSVLGTRANSAAALVAAATVAVAFAPVRDRLQRSVDRLLYGDRGDPYAVLSSLGRNLDAATTSSADVLTEIAATVASSLRLPYVVVEIDRAGEAPIVAAHGSPVNDLHEVPLTFRGRPVGRLQVAPRTARDPFRAADLRLLDDLGRQIGVAAHAARLAADLQRSREGLVTMREEERRRIRRDLHDGLGPALAGVALGLDALNRIALDDPAGASVLADQLRGEVQASLADVRRLVEDLRPPALDQLGLVGAVRQHGTRLTERDPGLEVAVDASSLPPLPAAVEVAAYRIATEALTNVSRHAGARHCHVGLSVNGSGALRVEIEDDGQGLPTHPRAGVGLTAMRERAVELGGTCEAGPASPYGTRVIAHLPLESR